MGTIVSFPATYPDEDYRSILYRYHLRSPYSSYNRSRSELIGKKSSRLLMYPENLNCLVNELGVSNDFIHDLINNHTFYPLFRPFLTSEQNEACVNDMIYPSTKYLKATLLTSAKGRSLISRRARYCPQCLRQDLKTYGECYLHRTHQYSFLSVCPIHQSSLITYCPLCNVSLVNDVASLMLIEPQCVNGHVLEVSHNSESLQPTIRNFLVDMRTLFQMRKVTLKQIHQKLLACAGNRGYVHFKGDYIYKKNLLCDVVDFYSEEHLAKLGMSIDKLYSTRFISEFLQLQKLRKEIPVYLLLMRFFSGSVANFIAHEELYSNPLPFGTGPWLCINPTCPHYNEGVITDCKRKAHEWITGTFTCPHCGATYVRKGLPNDEDESHYSVETMGSLFINSAIKYYEQGHDITTIAQLLGSNRTTVRKYLKPYRSELRQDAISAHFSSAAEEILLASKEVAITGTNSKLELCKDTVLEAMQTVGEGATRPQIRKYNMHRYDWVMKHERAWMEERLPYRMKLPKLLNLETLDDELYNLVNLAAEKLISNPPPSRTTKATIFKTLPGYVKSRYETFQHVLPKTKDLIEQSVETLDQYLVRKFPDTVEWFKESRYKRISLKLIQLRYPLYKKCPPEIKQWVQDQIKEIEKEVNKL